MFGFKYTSCYFLYFIPYVFLLCCYFLLTFELAGYFVCVLCYSSIDFLAISYFLFSGLSRVYNNIIYLKAILYLLYFLPSFHTPRFSFHKYNNVNQYYSITPFSKVTFSFKTIQMTVHFFLVQNNS